MLIEVRAVPLHRQPAETIVIPLFEGEALTGRPWQGVDQALRGLIAGLLKSGEFKPSVNATIVLHTPRTPGDRKLLPSERVVLVGLGKAEKVTPRTVCEAYGAAGKKIRELKRRSAATYVPEGSRSGDYATALVEGLILGQYDFRRYKTEEKADGPEAEEPVNLESLIVVESDARKATQIDRAMKRGLIRAEAVAFARDLQNRPSNDLTPQALAAAAATMAQEAGLSCEFWDETDLARWGMNAILAVGQGSANPPRFITVKYEPRGKATATVILVGKGITFDSGGISLKPGQGLEEMKFDMSGAAAVLGAMYGVAQLKPSVAVWGIVPAAENMPGGSSIKPGDIVKCYSGKTVEITNTDAEGRLVLCDALAYAVEQKPDALLDLATLTGACVVALGHKAAGMMGNNEALLTNVQAAGERSGDRVWPLPMWEDYDDLLKSHFADLDNAGPPRVAGAIVGGKFLEAFVGDTPWVHLDIAGTAWGDSDTPTTPKNLGSGYGVRLILQFLQDFKPS
ncbi:MAG: leucyl aminopeptidase [Armatimonadetes bacterium]|nr:leucyl aminopeptidase [Armatimonadota bacterium]